MVQSQEPEQTYDWDNKRRLVLNTSITLLINQGEKEGGEV